MRSGLLGPPLLLLDLPPLVVIRGQSPPTARAAWLLVHVVTPLGRTFASPPLIPVSTPAPPTLLLGPPSLVPRLPALALILPPAVLEVLVDVDQVPGVARHGLHPDLLDPLPLGPSLVILPRHVVQETLGLVEADPAEEAMIAALAREVAFADVQVVISVFVLVVILSARKHQVAQFAHILLGLLTRSLQNLQPRRVKDQVLEVILNRLVMHWPLDEELPLGHAFQPLVRILDGL